MTEGDRKRLRLLLLALRFTKAAVSPSSTPGAGDYQERWERRVRGKVQDVVLISWAPKTKET